MSQLNQSFNTIGNISTTLQSVDPSVNIHNDAQNTIVGDGAATFNVSGTENTVMGKQALQFSSGGSGMVAVGCLAGQSVASAAGAVMIGHRVAPLLMSALDCVLVGESTGINVVNASGSVFVGPFAGGSPGSPPVAISEGVVIGSRSTIAGWGATAVGARSITVGDGSLCLGCSNVHRSIGGITIGSLNGNSGDRSILVGQGLRVSTPDSLLLVAGAGGGQLNIQNVLTGGVDVAGAYNVGIGTATGTVTVKSLKGTFLSGGLVVEGRSNWTIESIPSTLNSKWSDLSMTSTSGTRVTFCDDFEPGPLNFTAQHRCVLKGGARAARPGSVLIATGSYVGLDGGSEPSVDEAVPVVELSTASRDARVFGVLSRREADGPSRSFRVGSMGFHLPRPCGDTPRIVVNSGGEGCILVCGCNGPIRNGDLLVSSSREGVAMRQDDDLVRACTVAKATSSSSQVADATHLIGCVYMC